MRSTEERPLNPEKRGKSRKERSFPVELKLGSVSVKIYRNPLIVKPDEKDSDSRVTNGGMVNGDSVDGDSPGSRTYDSYLVAYYEGTRRVRLRVKDFATAQSEANRILVKLANADAKALELSGDDRRIYVAALDYLKDTGVTLDFAAKEYSDAGKILQGRGIVEAAHFYVQHGMLTSKSGTVPAIKRQFLADLEADNSSEGSGYHQRDLKQRLGVFEKQFSGEIASVTTGAMNDWLRGLNLAPKTRNHYRDAAINLFHYAQKNGYLPRALPTAADDTIRVADEGGEIEIFTVPEMKKLLANSPSHLIPSLTIKAFSGLRSEEMIRIHWHHIHFDKKCVILTRDVTKGHKRRIIPMQDNLLDWLEPFKNETGRICAQWARFPALFRAWDGCAQKLGIAAGGNKFRHSYISYRTAQTSNLGKVALESGNSVNIIQESYLELVTEAEAKEWFSIGPR